MFSNFGLFFTGYIQQPSNRKKVSYILIFKKFPCLYRKFTFKKVNSETGKRNRCIFFSLIAVR